MRRAFGPWSVHAYVKPRAWKIQARLQETWEEGMYSLAIDIGPVGVFRYVSLPSRPELPFVRLFSWRDGARWIGVRLEWCDFGFRFRRWEGGLATRRARIVQVGPVIAEWVTLRQTPSLAGA